MSKKLIIIKRLSRSCIIRRITKYRSSIIHIGSISLNKTISIPKINARNAIGCLQSSASIIARQRIHSWKQNLVFKAVLGMRQQTSIQGIVSGGTFIDPKFIQKLTTATILSIPSTTFYSIFPNLITGTSPATN